MAPAPGTAPAGASAATAGLSPFHRTFAFGEPDGKIWGVGLVPAQSPGSGVLGGEAEALALALEGDSPEGIWRVQGERLELALEPTGSASDAADEPDGFDQLCQVSGEVEGPSGRQKLACLGWRSARRGDRAARDSWRQVAAWFDPEDGFALLARRPRKAHDQEHDEVTAALLGSEQPGQVAESRLSTTYDSAGLPVRASIELWLTVDEESDEQYPRRALAEALGVPVQWTVDGAALTALPVRWHSSHREGMGIYLTGLWAASKP